MEYAKVMVTAAFELEIASARTGVVTRVSLGRVAAQILSDCLAEYAGTKSKSVTRGHATSVSVQDLTDYPRLASIEANLPKKKSRPVKLHGPLGGVVRLNRGPGGREKS